MKHQVSRLKWLLRILLLAGLSGAVCFPIITGCGEETLFVTDTVYVIKSDTLHNKDTIYLAGDTLILTDKSRFVGSENCAGCHEEIAEKFNESGHPYMLNKITENKAPDYPGFIKPPDLPEGVSSWDKLEYVIGGYMQPAQFFLNDSGYLYGGEGGKIQYACGRCHTTGYDKTAPNQGSLPGISGGWAEPGVQCEACHGPGNRHIAANGLEPMKMSRSSGDCGRCHASATDSLVRKYCLCDSGYDMHSEISAGKKSVMDCVDCHDPHASTYHDKKAKGEGIRRTCESCHPAEAKSFELDTLHGKASAVTCVDCHMPRISGKARSHLFYITKDPRDTQFDGHMAVNPYIALEFACLSCHGSDTAKSRANKKDKAWAAKYAAAAHGGAVDTSYLPKGPDYRLQALGDSIKDFQELAGKKVFLFYASATCSHCHDAFPAVDKFSKKLDSLGIYIVVLFSGHSSLEQINQFRTDSNITQPAFHDVQSEFFSKYGEGGVPMFMAFNKAGEWKRQTGYSEKKFTQLKKNFLAFWE